jgi:hypothetical protein
VFLEGKRGHLVTIGTHPGLRPAAESLAAWLEKAYDATTRITYAGPQYSGGWVDTEFEHMAGGAGGGYPPVHPRADIVIGNCEETPALFRYLLREGPNTDYSTLRRRSCPWLPLAVSRFFPGSGRAVVMLSAPVVTPKQAPAMDTMPGSAAAIDRQLVVGVGELSDALRAVAALDQAVPRGDEVAGQVAAVEPVILPFRINCGSAHPYTDKDGQAWQPDAEFVAGSAWGAVAGGTAQGRAEGEKANADTSPCPGIYASERYGMPEYRIALAPGSYTVRLHFAETYLGAPGRRVFSLLLNERLVLRDFDPLAAGGAKNVATVREFKSVQPVNGMLTIGFEKERQSPCVNGIEIVSE